MCKRRQSVFLQIVQRYNDTFRIFSFYFFGIFKLFCKLLKIYKTILSEVACIIFPYLFKLNEILIMSD